MLPSTTRVPLVIIPGIDNSGPAHWQSYWEASHPDSRRIKPASFDRPDLRDWVKAIDDAVSTCDTAPVLVAHSLGCLAILEWAKAWNVSEHVAAILLVAVPDPTGAAFPTDAGSFTRVTSTPLGVPSSLVASTNDPYGSFDYAAAAASTTGAHLHPIGAVGHINENSGLGDWPEGQQLLADLIDRLAPEVGL